MHRQGLVQVPVSSSVPSTPLSASSFPTSRHLLSFAPTTGYRLQDFVAGLLGNKRGGLALPSLGRQVVLVWRRSGVKFLNERIYALLDISMVIILGLILGAIQVGAAGGRAPHLIWRLPPRA